jgi:copper transport protein
LTFGLFVLWLHLVAIVVWVGGLLAISLVCVPVVMKEVHSPQAVAGLVSAVVHRFQSVSWELVSLILLTGIFNTIHVGSARGFEFGPTYVEILGAKVGLFAAIVAVQAWQSYRLVPALAALASGTRWNPDSSPPELGKLKRRALTASLLVLVLAASAIVLGLELRYH